MVKLLILLIIAALVTGGIVYLYPQTHCGTVDSAVGEIRPDGTWGHTTYTLRLADGSLYSGSVDGPSGATFFANYGGAQKNQQVCVTTVGPWTTNVYTGPDKYANITLKFVSQSCQNNQMSITAKMWNNGTALVNVVVSYGVYDSTTGRIETKEVTYNMAAMTSVTDTQVVPLGTDMSCSPYTYGSVALVR